MINFSRLKLSNGLTGLVHTDPGTPLVALNILVKAGSKHDPETRSGLAHLLEHLMFKGSASVPDFDQKMQLAAGENNAYTNADYATYYCSGPIQNVETFLWLEHDRLLGLELTEEKLALEKKVVLEEYLDTCVNEPFGDVWHHLLPMLYEDHPYHWPTIGKNTVEISNIDLRDTTSFFQDHYRPTEMIVSLSGNISEEVGSQLIQKWFGALPLNERMESKDLNGAVVFPQSTKTRRLVSPVPVSTFYLAWMIPARVHSDYPAIDMLSEVLSGGRSSLLYQHLVKGTQSLSQVDCYLSGAIEGGLFIIEGRLSEGADFARVYKQIRNILDQLAASRLSETVMARLKNSIETALALSEMNVLSKAINLCYYELLGDANMMNQELDSYRDVTGKKLQGVINKYLSPDRMHILEYAAKKD